MKNITIRHTLFSAILTTVIIVAVLLNYTRSAEASREEVVASPSVEVKQKTTKPVTSDIVKSVSGVAEKVIEKTAGQNPIPKNLRPVHIDIPAAKVDADVINVGVTATNNLDVPPNFVQTGWYKFGPIPGQKGNAVIDGHVDNGGSIAGVFKHLRDTTVGDVISITLSDETVVRYKIIKSEVVKTTEFPSHDVFVGGDAAILKIITCHGTFRHAMDTYDQRLIVTAQLVV